MSWRDILKDAKTISQTSGSFNFEEEEIPEQDDKDCVKELKEYYDKAKNHPHAIGKATWSHLGEEFFHWYNSIPENVACALVERIKSAKRGKGVGYSNIEIDDDIWTFIVRYVNLKTSSGGRYQLFKVICYDSKEFEDGMFVRFGTKSYDLDDNIDFR